MHCNEANSIYSIGIKILAVQINYNHSRGSGFSFSYRSLSTGIRGNFSIFEFFHQALYLFVFPIPSFLFASWLRGRIKPKLTRPLAIRELEKEDSKQQFVGILY